MALATVYWLGHSIVGFPAGDELQAKREKKAVLFQGSEGGTPVARKNRVYLGNPRASHSAAKHNAAAHLFLSHAQASQLTFLALL